MTLSDDARKKLTHIRDLVGNETAEAFVTILKNSSTGDLLEALLQFLVSANFDDEVERELVTCLIDPAFDAGNATEEAIRGMAYIIKGALEGQRTLPDLSASKAIWSASTARIAAWQQKKESRMQKPELVAHLAAKCGISQEAVDAVLRELAELAVRETNDHYVFEIPGIGTMVKLFREERMGRNPQTGEEILIHAKIMVRFRLESTVRAMCGDTSGEPMQR